MTSVAQALASAARAGIDRLDGQLLLLHALGTPAQQTGARRAWLLSHGDAEVPEPADEDFRQWVGRRADGEPLAYLTGHKEFFGLDLHVDARVLVPRPDTEVLVQWALDVLQDADTAGWTAPLSALDLGTGSGAVALALQHTRRDLLVYAVDASLEALQVARANAQALGLDIRFMHGSWLTPVSGLFHCIVANPPYIAEHDPHLAALRHEPAQALVAGTDGLDDLRDIVANAGAHLHPGGWLLVEHGYDQAAAVRELFCTAGYGRIASRRDLGGHERCTAGRVIGSDDGPLVK